MADALALNSPDPRTSEGPQPEAVCALVAADGQVLGSVAVDHAPPGLRAVLTRGGEVVAEHHFEASPDLPEGPTPTSTSLADQVGRYERRLIEAALVSAQGNRARASRLLGTTERILGYRIQQYGIDCDRFRTP